MLKKYLSVSAVALMLIAAALVVVGMSVTPEFAAEPFDFGFYLSEGIERIRLAGTYAWGTFNGGIELAGTYAWGT